MAVGGIRKSCERHLFAAADTKNLQLTSYMNYFQTHLIYILPSCHSAIWDFHSKIWLAFLLEIRYEEK